MRAIIRNSLLLVAMATSVSFHPDEDREPIPFLDQDSIWVDSVFNSLTPDERIAQLFMVAAYSNKGAEHVAKIKKLVSEYKIGGLIFFQGGPIRQAQLTNKYQSLAKVPLLISMDAEWGLAMRLDSTVRFPKQMALGAIQDDSLIYEMGREIARHCKRLGVHVNLAPVADVNNNPKNPVINMRSFGEDKFNVARKGIAYMKGMQDERVLANAKHFPGHGDTDSDSHKTLPFIGHTRARIDSLELYPFKELMKRGLGSVMVAHLYIPAYEAEFNRASTLSKPIVTGLLKEKLGFEGLIFTDALNMKGVSKYFAPGIVDVNALLAGNDILLFSEDVPTAIREIKKAVAEGKITQEEIDKRCKKLLATKKWVGLDDYHPIHLEHLYDDLNNDHADYLNRKLAESSITLLQNKNDLLPLKRLDTLKIASLSIGYRKRNQFQHYLDQYAKVTHFNISRDAGSEEYMALQKKLKGYNLILVDIHRTNNSFRRGFGLNPSAIDLMKQLRFQSKVVVSLFSNPYILSKIDGLESMDAVLMSYEHTFYTHSLTAQAIFGGIKPKGKLPVTASPSYKRGNGLSSTETIRLKYTVPEDVGINPSRLAMIDSIVWRGIREKAYPGCQVLAAKDGKVFYHKSFGHHTYDAKRKVKNSDLYDIASITKITATVPSLMRLVDEGQVTLDDRFCYHLGGLDSSNKMNMVFREVLSHQAGLRDWIPFFLRTVKKGVYKEGIYEASASDDYPIRVAENLYIHKDYPEKMMQRIVNSKVKNEGKYRYSDLGYYLFQKIIEHKVEMSLDQYMEEQFYQPLGMTRFTYLPREKFSLKEIIPTEHDHTFRKQLIHGDVHDQGAAMLGGVAGHAGLFGTSNDLAKMMQLYLNGGEYGGQRFLDSVTIKEFTKCQFCKDENANRRGAGFDKPEMDYDKPGPTCECVSYLSFGHTGFTGTMAWADPSTGIVYIFLSNRVHPTAKGNKLVKLGTRTQIQRVLSESVNDTRESL